MKPIYLSISECPPKRTVHRYKTWDEVQAAKKLIDECGCGGQCLGSKYHRIHIRMPSGRKRKGESK